MNNYIAQKIAGYEKNNMRDWFLEFIDKFNENYDSFAFALIEMRDTGCNCISDQKAIDAINSCSRFYLGKDVVVLDVVKMMLFYNIDTSNNIKFLLKRRHEIRTNPVPGVMMQYDIAYDAVLSRIFSNNFEKHNGKKIVVDIDEYICVGDIKDVSLADTYYSSIKATKPDVIQTIPKKILVVGFISEAFGIIEGDGLGSFYECFSEGHIHTVCECLVTIGLSRFADIILSGLNNRDDYDKIENLENKLFNLQEKISVNGVLDKYLQQEM